MKVYLEIASQRTREYNLLRNYCLENNIQYESITQKDIDRGRFKLEDDCVVDGLIPFVHSCLKFFNKKPPVVDTYPPELREFMYRSVIKTTLGNVREGFYGFIKPATQVKKFTGFVVNDPSDLQQINYHSRHTEVYLTDIVKFVSEYRYYIINRKIKAVGHYDGDETIKCDDFVVQSAIEKMEHKLPSACCIDFGILDSGQTALVEYNDAYSVGWYLDADVDIYYELISIRWKELKE